MPTWARKANLAALNTARYEVPQGRVVSLAQGVEMLVRSGFRIDGMLVLDGMLTVKGRTKWA
jgi:hypothetical protein